MARMPGAEWKPLPNPSKTRMARYDLVVLHTCVGSLTGTHNYFKSLTNGVNSHFLTGGYGENWQLVDTAVRSGANGAGNHRAITVENADMGPGFAAWDTRNGAAVPAFTAQQIEANAQICAWAHLEHGVPLQAADTSRPSARGIGYHRLGCDNWRVSDGERWSSSVGKVCPGERRIAQIPQIIARARQIVAGAPVIEEDDMPLTTEDYEKIADFVWNRPQSHGKWEGVPPIIFAADTRSILGSVASQTAALATKEGVEVDEEKLAAALAPALVPAIVAALGDKAGLVKEDVEQAVRDVLKSLQSTLP